MSLGCLNCLYVKNDFVALKKYSLNLNDFILLCPDNKCLFPLNKKEIIFEYINSTEKNISSSNLLFNNDHRLWNSILIISHVASILYVNKCLNTDTTHITSNNQLITKLIYIYCLMPSEKVFEYYFNEFVNNHPDFNKISLNDLYDDELMKVLQFPNNFNVAFEMIVVCKECNNKTTRKYSLNSPYLKFNQKLLIKIDSCNLIISSRSTCQNCLGIVVSSFVIHKSQIICLLITSSNGIEIRDLSTNLSNEKLNISYCLNVKNDSVNVINFNSVSSLQNNVVNMLVIEKFNHTTIKNNQKELSVKVDLKNERLNHLLYKPSVASKVSFSMPKSLVKSSFTSQDSILRSSSREDSNPSSNLTDNSPDVFNFDEFEIASRDQKFVYNETDRSESTDLMDFSSDIFDNIYD